MDPSFRWDDRGGCHFRITEKNMSKSFHITKQKIDETLASAPAKGKKLLEPLKSIAAENKLPINLLENAEVLDNKAEVHMEEGDLWLGLEGETTFIVGGELIDPFFSKGKDGVENKNELRAADIKNGEKIILKPGDWLWIPAGEPHRHFCAEVSRLAIIKIPRSNRE